MSQLAIKGGDPVRKKLFPAYNTIGKEEKEAVRGYWIVATCHNTWVPGRMIFLGDQQCGDLRRHGARRSMFNMRLALIPIRQVCLPAQELVALGQVTK